VSDIMSKLRCLGEHLVLEKYWKKNPLQWLRGPKINPYGKVPCRVSRDGMTKLWQGAATTLSDFRINSFPSNHPTSEII
jgi:hypothetical protein